MQPPLQLIAALWCAGATPPKSALPRSYEVGLWTWRIDLRTPWILQFARRISLAVQPIRSELEETDFAVRTSGIPVR